MDGHNRTLTITDKNINHSGRCSGRILEANSLDSVQVKEELKERGMIAQTMLMKFSTA